MSYTLLEQINDPQDLRALPRRSLAALADELRAFLIESVSRTGGHLSAGLGTVELTIALHYVFNTPGDRLVWDVGHQSYPHKILTGRRDRFPTLRRQGGLSGFPKRDESPYDTFGVGHSSTSISAALGMAVAAQRAGIKREVVAVIGDGAMTAGMAFEALNNAGSLDADLLVVLNDNEMSISPNVGAFSSYLAKLLSSRLYNSVRQGADRTLKILPPIHELARRAEEHVKGMVTPGTLFEELGFTYYGPIDGHDLDALLATLENLKRISGPRLLHVITKKGKGYAPAEADPCVYHGVTAFDLGTGKMEKKPGGAPSYTQVFGDWLCEMAARDAQLVGITPAMREGSGMVAFSERFPAQYFDVGIAEQHALTFAAGLAAEGMRPVVAIYSTFLQRAYDQLVHDIAIQKLPVLLAVDRAGLVGADGATHQGSFDLSYLRCIPGLVIMAPKDENELRHMLFTGYRHDGPAVVRYPRGSGLGVALDAELRALPLGRGEVLRRGRETAILAFGSRVAAALAAGEILDATVVNMRFVKPLDEALVQEIAERHQFLITVEENAVAGGAGSAVAECLAARGCQLPLALLGLPDQFVEQGDAAAQLAALGLDRDGIVRAAQALKQTHSLVPKNLAL
ncbi:MAG: 1-deoxy-D-xylulose-5-phosphate synthase [Pseudomonadota bacterium]